MLDIAMLKMAATRCKCVEFYPYRTAHICPVVVSMEAETLEEREQWDEILEFLCKHAALKYNPDTKELEQVNGVPRDNHVSFSIEGTNIQFSDYRIYIGATLLKEMY